MAVPRAHLDRLYAATDDPWDFRASAYEAARFAATFSALPRVRYSHALELGCGNGELARRIAPRCAAYTGVDAVKEALAAAHIAVPGGQFVQAFLPCPLPDAEYDLILLSEILYFLDKGGLRDVAQQIDARWPAADVVAVTWLGPSGNPIEGNEAVSCFAKSTRRCSVPAPPGDALHRIDLFLPLEEPRT